MRILHLSTADANNGAARAAYRLHRGLLQTGITSRMLVAIKHTDDETVVPADLSRRLDRRLRRHGRRQLLAIDERRIARSLQPQTEFFSTDRSQYSGLWSSEIESASVLNLHSVMGFVDSPSFFASLPADNPLVWTLHDMNPFTGGCIYSTGCNKFTSVCEACPALGSRNTRDISSRIFRSKRAAYENISPEFVRIVAPSRWLAAEAKKSALFSKFNVETIPYGIDTNLFKPRNKIVAREIFGIPPTCKVIMFVAEWVAAYRKGFDLLLAALHNLEAPFEVGVATVGGGRLDSIAPLQHFPFGRLTGERLLSLAYSAADVVVCPTREDNLPSVVLEAMSCGTPVVAFEVGGLPDMVRPKMTGLLAPANDVRALRDAIKTVLSNDAQRKDMMQECRRIAISEYGLELQAKRYAELYDQLLPVSRTTAGHTT